MGIGAQIFKNCWQTRVIFAESGVDGKKCGAQHGQGADEDGISTARVILAQDGIPGPMVADFDAAPMSADGLDPMVRGQSFGAMTGDEVAAEGCEGFPGALVDAAAGDAYERASAREVALQGVCGVDGDLIGDEMSVFGFCAQGKKGVFSRVWRTARRRSLGLFSRI